MRPCSTESERGNSIVEYTIMIAFLLLGTLVATRALGVSVRDALQWMGSFLVGEAPPQGG
jgi:hypothetical protein